MNIKFESPVIFVNDIEISKDFYINNLDQEVKFDFGANITFESGLSLWDKSKALNTIFQRDTWSSQHINTNNFELYFESNDIKNAHKKIKNKGINLIQELHEEPWSQQTFRFFDPDNYIIEIGESIKSWVERLYNKKMTPKEISESTTLPLETVNKIIKGLSKK